MVTEYACCAADDEEKLRVIAPVVEKVKLLMREFADLTAAELASRFRLQGVRAVRSCPESCVIAQVLQNATGHSALRVYDAVVCVYASDKDARWTDADHLTCEASVPHVTVWMPDPVPTFIEQFDRGLYPELDVSAGNPVCDVVKDTGIF